MNYPEYAEVNGKRYKINTDFRVAIKCNNIALDKSINDFERALAIIYKMFGEEGLNDFENHDKLLDCALKFLSCNKEIKNSNNEEPDMDFDEDMDYIEASFMSDYNIDLTNEKMHWWKFSKLLNGLSNSEMGNCCILNRIRNLRNYDLKDIPDARQREKMRKAKEQVALKRNKRELNLTKEQEESMNRLNEILGI